MEKNSDGTRAFPFFNTKQDIEEQVHFKSQYRQRNTKFANSSIDFLAGSREGSIDSDCYKSGQISGGDNI